MDSRVELREITRETLGPILDLDVTPEQRRFVASNAISIAEAHFEAKAWFRAVYAGETPVGFVMLFVDRDKPEYHVWRFMIDRRHQRKGYGRAAMQSVLRRVESWPQAPQLTLSYVPGEGDPAPFYRSLGFVETGEIDDGETVMALKLPAAGV